MRVLIHNYSTPQSTEPLYLTEAFNAIDGVTANIWSPQVDASTFDVFDSFKPDLFITDIKFISNDIIKYLSSSPNLQIIVNVSDAQQEHIDQAKQVFEDNNINCPFLFFNNANDFNKLKRKGVDLVSLMFGADIYLGKQNINSPEFKADLGVFSDYDARDRLDDVVSDYRVHHFLSSNEELAGDVDIAMHHMHTYALFPKYGKSIVTTKESVIPQSFFDSVIYGNETYILPRYEGQRDKLSETLKKVLNVGFDLTSLDSEIDFTLLRRRVLESHTCLSRAKRICEKLKQDEIAKLLQQEIEFLSWA